MCGICGGAAHATHTPCCSAHLAVFGEERTRMCCSCYCRSHFVEVGCGHAKHVVDSIP